MFRKKRTVNLKLWASRLLKSWGTRIYNFCIWSSRSWTSLWSWGLNLLTQPRRASWSFGRSGPYFLGQEWRPTFYFFLGSECLRLRGKRTLTGAPLRERLNRKKKKVSLSSHCCLSLQRLGKGAGWSAPSPISSFTDLAGSFLSLIYSPWTYWCILSLSPEPWLLDLILSFTVN